MSKSTGIAIESSNIDVARTHQTEGNVTESTPHHKKTISILCFLAIIVCPAWLSFCRFDDPPGPDNGLSIAGAQALVRGDGYSRFDYNDQTDVVHKPQTKHISEFPPGVSILLYPWIAKGFDGTKVLKTVELLVIVCGAACWVQYLNSTQAQITLKLLLALLIGVNCTPLRIGTTLSDAIVWSLFPIWLTQWNALNLSLERYSRGLTIITALTSAMVLVRYQCIALVAANGLLTWSITKSAKLPAVFTVVLPTLVFASVLAWNKSESGATSFIAVTNVPPSIKNNLAALVHPSPVETLATRPLGISWIADGLFRRVRLPGEQVNGARLILAIAVISFLCAFRFDRILGNVPRRALHFAYLVTLALLVVLTLRDTGIRPGWTFIEDERYYLFLYPAFAIEAGFALTSISQRYLKGFGKHVFLTLITLGSVFIAGRYCVGIWKSETSEYTHLYRTVNQVASNKKRAIAIGADQVLRSLPIEVYPRSDALLNALLIEAPHLRREIALGTTAIVIPEETPQYDLEDRLAQELGMALVEVPHTQPPIRMFSTETVLNVPSHPH
jgi:hypothetical protein